jgi:hypothetical protein
MSDNITLPTLSFSYDKNMISNQKVLTKKLKKDIKIIKHQILLNDKKKINLNKLHHESFKTFYNNRNSQTIKSYLTNQTSNNILSSNYKINSTIYLFNSLNKGNSTDRTLSFASNNNSIQKYNKTFHSNSHYKGNKTRNKIKLLFILNPKKTRAESIEELKDKTKQMFYEKYCNKIQENLFKTITEEKKIAHELIDYEIYKFKKMNSLIESYIYNTDKYLIYLQEKIKKESNINLLLSEKKKEILYETYLLRFRFERLQKLYEKCIENKFFLLCVKNNTNNLEKFSEEDQNDYKKDCDSLQLIKNYNKIHRQLAKKKTLSVKGNVKRYSILEENIYNGIEIIRNPKPIFSNPELFKNKLDTITHEIQNSIINYNEKNNILLNLRENFINKLKEIEKEETSSKYFEEEIQLAEKKLFELKIRNDYLKNYLKNIPKYTNNNLDSLLYKKIKEIHNKINKREKFINNKINELNENESTISRLLDIENKINFLIDFKRKQEENNHENYILLKKTIEINNKIKDYHLAKLKKLNEIKQKEKKIIDKNNKIIFKPIKKVVEKYFFKK